MMSVQMKKVHDRAAEINKNLKLTDFNPNQIVEVVADDASFVWRSAFLVEHDPWIVVFTEHHDFHVYHMEECVRWGWYQRINEPHRVKLQD